MKKSEAKKMITRPTLHYATDRRCYNGAPCSDLKREWDSRDNIRKQIQAVEPEFHTTYFPAQAMHSGWIKSRKITDEYEDVGDALLEAWDKLIGGKQ